MSCKLSETSVAGMRAIYLENDYLKIGILTDRGSDIYEFLYKPKNIDFLLRLPKGILNPRDTFSQLRNTSNQFEDYYYGGWQVCLPNSPAFNYRGAELGQHGEVSLIPWQVEIVETGEERVIIKCSVSPVRIPIKIERTFRLERDAKELFIVEKLTNESRTQLDIMWGQHIAFGLPFLEEGVTIDTNAKTMNTEPSMSSNHRFKRGEVYQWPKAKTKAGLPDNADKFLPKGEGEYSELCYLEGYDKKAYYSVKNEIKNVGFALTWDGMLFKDLWLWQERNALKDFPWWGQCFTLALEPWTSKWTSEALEAIKNKEWLTVEAGSKIETAYSAFAFENIFKPYQS